VYYKLIEARAGSKRYFTLLGFDGYKFTSNRKIIEVLTFNRQGLPFFGAPVFNFPNEEYSSSMRRFILEYKEEAVATLHYSEDEKLIIFDHLVPLHESATGIRDQYVPDGSYEAFAWKGGKWNYIGNLFTSTQKEPPFPNPVRFEKEPKLH
jgi:hypothetical protein